MGLAVGFLLIGPANFLGIESNVWLSVGAMFVIGLSFSFAFIPTFEAVLQSVVASGAKNDLVTYSLVSGWWTSMDNFGELTGATLGGVFLDVFGFVDGSTIIAGGVLVAGLILTASYIVTVCRGCKKEATTEPEKEPLLARQSSYSGYGANVCDICDDNGNLLQRLAARYKSNEKQNQRRLSL